MIRALALSLALGLSACATPAVYGPAARPGGPGYSELRIENDRYRVNYRGAGSEAQAADYAILRAAEITLSQGYDWFVVDNRSTDRAGAASGPRVGVGIGGGNYGGRTSVGIGTSVGFNLGAGARSSVSLEIRLGRGAKPANANAYDARQVQQTLRERL